MFCGHSCLAGLFHLRRRPPFSSISPPSLLRWALFFVFDLATVQAPSSFSFVRIQAIHCSFIYPFLLSPVYIRSFPSSPIIRKGERDETEKKNGWRCPRPRTAPACSQRGVCLPRSHYYSRRMSGIPL